MPKEKAAEGLRKKKHKQIAWTGKQEARHACAVSTDFGSIPQ